MTRRGFEVQVPFSHEQSLAINLEVAKRFAATNLVLDEKMPPWLRLAVTDLRDGKTITAADIERYQNMGTTEA